MGRKLVAVFLILVFVVAALQIREAEADSREEYVKRCTDRCSRLFFRDFCQVFCMSAKEENAYGQIPAGNI